MALEYKIFSLTGMLGRYTLKRICSVSMYFMCVNLRVGSMSTSNCIFL